MDLTQAIQAHLKWKALLQTAITHKEPFDTSLIHSVDQCELGQWLLGEGKLAYGKLPTFMRLVRHHAEFHKEAANLARLINDGQFEDAEQQLAADASYSVKSKAVISTIQDLKSEIEQRLNSNPQTIDSTIRRW